MTSVKTDESSVYVLDSLYESLVGDLDRMAIDGCFECLAALGRFEEKVASQPDIGNPLVVADVDLEHLSTRDVDCRTIVHVGRFLRGPVCYCALRVSKRFVLDGYVSSEPLAECRVHVTEFLAESDQFVGVFHGCFNLERKRN